MALVGRPRVAYRVASLTAASLAVHLFTPAPPCEGSKSQRHKGENRKEGKEGKEIELSELRAQFLRGIVGCRVGTHVSRG